MSTLHPSSLPAVLLAHGPQRLVDSSKQVIERRAALQVITTDNGTEAIRLATRSQPDLILLGMDIEELQPFAVCETLAQHHDYHPAIWLIAPRSGHLIPHHVANLNIERILTQPIDSMNLCDQIMDRLNIPAITLRWTG